MEINGYTRVCGLIGNPVEHTMSPAIHAYLAEHTDKNLTYVPLPVEEGQLEQAVRGAYALNLLGLNITIPYKSAVIESLDKLDQMAEQIGAVNTLVRTEHGYKGFNTDMEGLFRGMCEDRVEVLHRKAVIIGAGGVARAVAILLASKGAKEIILINRTKSRADILVQELRKKYPDLSVQSMAIADCTELPGEEKYLAIQATNVGMYPNVDQTAIANPSFYKKIEVGYDLIFNPLDTRFMKLVSANGGRAYNGLKMLVYQAIIAYELWTGCEISDELARETYAYVLEKMHS